LGAKNSKKRMHKRGQEQVLLVKKKKEAGPVKGGEKVATIKRGVSSGAGDK